MNTLDLEELSVEYLELHDRLINSDEGLTEDEESRHDMLDEISSTLNNALDGGQWFPTLISEDDFEEYARDMAEDVGYVNSENPLMRYIDWERWASDLQSKYTPIEYEGITYYTNEV